MGDTSVIDLNEGLDELLEEHKIYMEEYLGKERILKKFTCDKSLICPLCESLAEDVRALKEHLKSHNYELEEYTVILLRKFIQRKGDINAVLSDE